MNATGAPAGMLVPHERFRALGADGAARAAAYRAPSRGVAGPHAGRSAAA
jgi:hypothetical protein